VLLRSNIIQTELIRWQRLQLIGYVWRFIVIPQRASTIKLKIPEIVLRTCIISDTLYGNAYFHGLPVGNIFWYGHHIYLKRKIVLYFEFIILAARYQRNRSCEDCQQYIQWQ